MLPALDGRVANVNSEGESIRLQRGCQLFFPQGRGGDTRQSSHVGRRPKSRRDNHRHLGQSQTPTLCVTPITDTHPLRHAAEIATCVAIICYDVDNLLRRRRASGRAHPDFNRHNELSIGTRWVSAIGDWGLGIGCVIGIRRVAVSTVARHPPGMALERKPVAGDNSPARRGRPETERIVGRRRVIDCG